MALSLNLKSMLSTRPARGRDDSELDMPTTTQVKMTPPAPGYDPLASVSIMEQLRTAAAEKRQPGRIPFIGHLPAATTFGHDARQIVVHPVVRLELADLQRRAVAGRVADRAEEDLGVLDVPLAQQQPEQLRQLLLQHPRDQARKQAGKGRYD